MEKIQEKAQQEQANDIRLTLEAAVEGLAPGSPEREAAFNKALENIASSVPKAEKPRSVWDFTVQKAQAVFASDEKTILRPVQITDADFYVRVKAQYSMMYRALKQLNKVDNESLLKSDLFLPESFFCIIEDAKSGTSVGYLGIKDTRADNWEIAIELDGQFTHKGFGTSGIRLFLNELHRISENAEYKALVEVDNLPSQMCFEKLGAKPIGLCNGPFLKLEEEKKRFEERYLNLIDDHMKELAVRLRVEPRMLLSHVLEYRLTCPLK